MDEAHAFIRQITDELTTGIHTRKDAWRAIGKAMKKGLQPFFTFSLVPADGIYYAMLLPTYAFEGQSLVAGKEYSKDNIRKHPELRDLLVPFVRVKTRAGTAADVLSTVSTEIGIDTRFIKLPPEQEQYLAAIEQMSPEEVTKVIKQCINKDILPLASHEDLAADNAANGTDYTLRFLADYYKEEFMKYVYSHAYATRYVSPAIKTRWADICEDMRTTFKQRINDLDWMSSTTKATAQKKLEAMTFNVAYPNHWHNDGLPALDGCKSFAEDLQQVFQAYFSLAKVVIGKSIKEEGFTVNSAFFENLSLNNAFYMFTDNSLSIYPAVLLPPFYSEGHSDAMLYTTAMTIGHEMTHGFDNIGAKFDELGNNRNWWTVSDKMDYQAKQQLLIDCYNKLEIMPEELPDIYADGTKTLSENISDLGGFELARQCYLTKLCKEGYTGTELVKQEKRFFQAYADLWQSKYEWWYAEFMLQNDNHSLPRERVNGVVMNCDRWYELYDVQWGNKLYLRPERRSRIW